MEIRNPYKRRDVFSCAQEAHARFKGRVSVYHVLKEKKCYPDGCLYFEWRCIRKEKGELCIHKYKFIGRNCKGCTYYWEEKMHFQPLCLVDQKTMDDLMEQIESFEMWLQSVRYKRLPVAGKIHTVKPWFEKTKTPHQNQLHFKGYLLILKTGHIAFDYFADTLYVRISEAHMRAHAFQPGMRFECQGEVREDRGRLVIHKPGQFEISGKGRGIAWTREKALTGMKTATQHEEQPEQCLQCPWGILTDVRETTSEGEGFSRQLHCLKGIESAEACYIYALHKERIRKRRKKNKSRKRKREPANRHSS